LRCFIAGRQYLGADVKVQYWLQISGLVMMLSGTESALAGTFTLAEPHYSADHFVPHFKYEGPVEAGDTGKLTALYESVTQCGMDCIGPDGGNTAIISLDSPGGNYVEGLNMAQYFRANAIATVVESGKFCYSACAFAFLGGSGFSPSQNIGPYIDRMVRPGAIVGFHAPYVPGDALEDLVNELGVEQVLGGTRESLALMVEKLVDWNVDPLVISTMLNMGPDQTYDLVTPNDLFLTRSALPPLGASIYQPDIGQAVYNACLRLLAIRNASTPSVQAYAVPGSALISDFGVDEFGNTLSGYALLPEGQEPMLGDVTQCGLPSGQLAGTYDLDIALYAAPGLDKTSVPVMSFFNRREGWSSAGTGGVSARRILQRGPMDHYFLRPDQLLSDIAPGLELANLTSRFFTFQPPALPAPDAGARVIAETPTSRVSVMGDIVMFEQVGSEALYEAALNQLGKHGATPTNDGASEISFVREGTMDASGRGFAYFGFKDGGGGAAVVRIESRNPQTEAIRAEIRRLECAAKFGDLQLGC
jgi:hypothetical protein